jgi:hypothetical protein
LQHVVTETRLEQQRAARPLRRHLRDAGVALASLIAISLLVLYALAGPSAKLTASVGPVVPRPGIIAVVQGRVTKADGGALQGARVEVRQKGERIATAFSDDSGEFQIALAGPCARYEVSLQAKTEGSTVDTDSRRRLCPGDTLPIDARVITQGHFIWVPGPR